MILMLNVMVGLLVVAPFTDRGRLVAFTLFRRASSTGSPTEEKPVPSLLLSLSIAVVAAGVSIPLFWMGVLWVSWLGMLLTTVPPLVEDLLKPLVESLIKLIRKMTVPRA